MDGYSSPHFFDFDELGLEGDCLRVVRSGTGVFSLSALNVAFLASLASRAGAGAGASAGASSDGNTPAAAAGAGAVAGAMDAGERGPLANSSLAGAGADA